MPDDREVVGDEDIGQAEAALQVHHQVDDLRLHRHVERRDRLVADDQPRLDGQRPGDADPLALAAARIRADSGAHDRGSRPTVRSSSATRVVDGLRGPGQPMQPQRLGQDLGHRHGRIQRRVRILEDHLQRAPPRAQRRRVELAEVLALEQHPPGRRLDQPQQQPPERRLAAAGFADHAQRLAGGITARSTPSTARTTLPPRLKQVPPRRRNGAPGPPTCSSRAPAARRRPCAALMRPRRAGGPDRAAPGGRPSASCSPASPAADRQQRRILPAAGGIGERTALGEAAADDAGDAIPAPGPRSSAARRATPSSRGIEPSSPTV